MVPIKEKLAWIPNLFTLGNLSLGFFAILVFTLESEESKFQLIASSLIVLAFLFDGLDGFAARLLRANSNLGAQLDSLADMVAFGIAPAVMMYSFLLSRINYAISSDTYIPVGMFIAAIWPACAAYRLARFNLNSKSDSFVGLPSPVAGAIVALMPLVFDEEMLRVPDLVLVLIYVFYAFMMVSTVRYTKPQVTFLRRFSKDRLGIIGFIVFFILIFMGWRYGLAYVAMGLFTLVFLYVVMGIVSFIIHTIQRYRM